MKLVCFNGSPRGVHSNTRLLLDYFNRGLMNNNWKIDDLYYLNRVDEQKKRLEAVKTATHIIIAFPLYTDSMPAITKRFFEDLAIFEGQLNNVSLGFIVQSGFPEPHHSRSVEAYLKRLCERLSCYYSGTAVRGAVELLRGLPRPILTYQLKRELLNLAHDYIEHQGSFTPKGLKPMAVFEKFSGWRKLIVLPMWTFIFSRAHWWLLLLKNRTWSKRHARPEGK